MAANANPTDAELRPQPHSDPPTSGGVLPWLTPSLTQWLWLVILLILLAQPWRTMMVASDGDACMHWRVGEYMLETGRILRHDVFSYTRLGQPIITKEWLSEIIFALAGRLAGLYGLVVVAALLIATTFALLHRHLIRETGNHAVAIFVALLAASAACTHWLARPHAFSFLLAVFWIDALRRFDRGKSALRLLASLGVLTLLWVNLHGGYLAGFITLGIYWFGTIIELLLARQDRPRWSVARRKLNVLTGAVVLCGLVSLLNPNGYHLHVHNLHFLRSDYLTNWLAEYASPNFHEIDSRGFMAWLAVTFLMLALVRPRLSPTAGILLIVWTYLALYSARNIPLLAIFVAPILATALAEASPAWVRRLSDRLRETYEMSHGWLLVGVAAVVAIAVIPRPTEMPPKKWPVEAVAYIHQHPDLFQGNMFNQYIWGGYLLHALPDHLVFVDGRTDFYGESLIRQYNDTSELQTNWLQALQQYQVSWTLLPTDQRLNLALALLPGLAMRLLQRGRHHFPQTTVKDASSHANTRTAGWLPSLSAMIWLTLFLGLTLSSARIVLLSADSDSALHRRLGEWVLQHHAIVRNDDLLHTYHGPFVSIEWLGGVLFALAARLCGWNGIVLIAATVIATCYWFLHWQLLAEGCDAILATVLVLVAMLACSIHWLARPLVFSHLLVLLYAWQLRWFQKGRVSPRQLFLLLPILMILWVNLHAGFVLGLILVGMHLMGSSLTAWRESTAWNKPRTLAILFFLCCAASLVNPNGWRLHYCILDFLRNPELSTVTSEFGSPNFHTVGMRGFLLLLFLLVAVLLVIRPQLNATDVLLVGGWGYFALFAARNVPIFTLVMTPLVAQWINEFLQGNRDAWWSRYYRGWASRIIPRNGSAGAAFIIAAVVCVTLIMTKPALAGGPPILVTDFPSNRYPTEVVPYLREHPTLIHGEMFNSSLWSGYLEFSFPEHKPFIDSRADFYGLTLIREFRTVSVPKPGWEAVLARYHVGWTMLPPQHPLNQILQLSPDWRLVFSNRQALVYSRKP